MRFSMLSQRYPHERGHVAFGGFRIGSTRLSQNGVPMDPRPSLIKTDIDFDRAGIQTSVLRIPYSHNRSAYGFIPVPIVVARQGEGPTILLTGGTHGDEYEGPLALGDLIRSLDLARLNGRLIIIPALNFPAYLAATRTSPIDGVNLNRTFPGRRNGTVTEMLAHYVEGELLSRADYAIDLHAGGSSLDYLPSLLVFPSEDATACARQDRLVDAFGAPLTIEMNILGEDRTFNAAAARHDVEFLTGEFGGGASVNLDGLAIVRNGLAGVLDALGVLARREPATAPATRRRLVVKGAEHYVYAPCPGIFEPRFRLGDRVEAGALAGLVHDPVAPWREPTPVPFAGSGIAVCVRTYASVTAGDCLGHLAA